jgi:COMPASS component SWD3
MSDTDFSTSTPAGSRGYRSPKRRRVDSDYEHPSRRSSPDELAADHDYDSASARLTGRNSRRDSEPRRRSYEESDESPDELDHTFFRESRGRRRSRSRRRSTSESLQSQRSLTESEEKIDQEQCTPTPTPPPPKKIVVGYKPTLVLRGHQKGVSQVKFSPDGKWIASCCK